MGTEANTTDDLDIQDLAAQMLGLDDDSDDEDYESDDEFDEEDEDEDDMPQAGHPAWQSILANIPEELHSKVIPTLQQWDAGVSRQFQKIHDQYEPLKRFKEYDPDEVNEAVKVYQALTNDPASTWEAIGRVYGLSPQQVSQATSSDDEDDFDLDDLPPGLKQRLAKLDVHDQVLEAVTQELLDRQASEQEAQEDQELEEYIEELHDEYGDFDEEYVVGLLAAGVDGEEAVGRFQQLAAQYAPPVQQERTPTPRVMSSGGGVPSDQDVDLYKLSSQNTRNLVAEILRLSHES